MRYVHYAVIVVMAALLTASAPPRSVARPSDPAAVASGEPAACSPAERARRARAATALARALPIRRRAFFRAHRGASARRAFVRREAARLARLRRLAAACRPSAPPPPAPAPPPEHPQPFTFWPQAGILFGDLFRANFVDLDDGPGIRDWSCGSQAYDSHGGLDTAIRSFREQAIGVPIFAALDGVVREVQDYEPDENYGATPRRIDNHVVLDHGGTQQTVYGHLRRGHILVRVGQRVRAGQQLGLTGSSGNSSGPHLHFGARFGSDVYEPFAGPCRPGPSYWTEQPAYERDTYVSDVALSASPFEGQADWPFDEAVRTGAFVAGRRAVHVRIELANPSPAADERLRILRPDGSVALERTGGIAVGRYTTLKRRAELDLDVLGTWRVLYELGGRALVDAPFDVVPSAADVLNRPPLPVAAELVPAAPRPDDVVSCRVRTSLVREDPDYDIVSYRYRWTVDGRVLRTSRNAALSDVLPRRTALAGSTLGCSVTPTHGRLDGPSADVSTTVR